MAMKLLKLLFILSITTSIVLAASSADEKHNNEDTSVVGAAWSADGNNEDSTVENHLALPEGPESYIALPKITCDRFPQICHWKSSPGPDCCNKKCVDVLKDPLNCGACRRRCKRNEICCSGRCVNPSIDARNCGRCGKKCREWETCVFGMCSYA